MKLSSALCLAALCVAALLLVPGLATAQETPSLIGTWRFNVAFDPDPGAPPPFQALQTFHLGGTMTETSSLLGSLAEGPAAGAWRGAGPDYEATFHLFIFDQEGRAAGSIRVRESLRIESANRLSGRHFAELLLPGQVIPLGGGTIEGFRVRVLPIPQ